MSQHGNKRKKGVGTALLATSLAGSAMGAATSGSVSAMLGNNINNNKGEDYDPTNDPAMVAEMLHAETPGNDDNQMNNDNHKNKDKNNQENENNKEIAINMGIKKLKILGKLEEAFNFVDRGKDDELGLWVRTAEVENNLILEVRFDENDFLELEIYKKENKKDKQVVEVAEGFGEVEQPGYLKDTKFIGSFRVNGKDLRIFGIQGINKINGNDENLDKAIVDFLKKYFTVSHDDNKSLDSLKIFNFSKQLEILDQKIKEALHANNYFDVNKGKVYIVNNKNQNQCGLNFIKKDKTFSELIIESPINGRPRIVKQDGKFVNGQMINVNKKIVYESETGQFDTKFIEKVAEAIENASVPLTSRKIRINVPEKAKGFEDIKVEASSSFENLADQMQSAFQKARDKQGRIGEKKVDCHYNSEEESIEIAIEGLSKIKIKRGNKGEIFSNAFVDEKGDLNVVANVGRKLKSGNVADVLLKALGTTEKNAFSFKLINNDSYDLWGEFSYVPYGERIE